MNRISRLKKTSIKICSPSEKIYCRCFNPIISGVFSIKNKNSHPSFSPLLLRVRLNLPHNAANAGHDQKQSDRDENFPANMNCMDALTMKNGKTYSRSFSFSCTPDRILIFPIVASCNESSANIHFKAITSVTGDFFFPTNLPPVSYQVGAVTENISCLP